LCNPRGVFLLDLKMKSEVSDSYERMLFNFLCECFRYCMVHYKQVGSAMSHWVTGLPALQV
jgi:hypothetical protein